MPLKAWEELPKSEVLIRAVGHRKILSLGPVRMLEKVVDGGRIVDVQARFDATQFAERDIAYWRP